MPKRKQKYTDEEKPEGMTDLEFNEALDALEAIGFARADGNGIVVLTPAGKKAADKILKDIEGEKDK